MLFAFNQGEVCTCPSRALIQESIYDRFIERAMERVAAIKQGNPLDTETMMGAQASAHADGQDPVLPRSRQAGRRASADRRRPRGTAAASSAGGYYIQPTLFKGNNKMRVFREEIFGPVLAVTTFKDEAEALAIANDTPYGLGAGVWTRDGSRAYRMGRAIKAGRVWTNCYHAYPAHAAFGGYKESGIGRETHKMMLDHYQQTKNLLVSYSPTARLLLIGRRRRRSSRRACRIAGRPSRAAPAPGHARQRRTTTIEGIEMTRSQFPLRRSAAGPSPACAAAALAALGNDELAQLADQDGQWPMYGRDYDNTHFSPLKQITKGNVGKLKLAYTLQLGALRSNESTPIVIGDTMYLSSSSGPKTVFALDAKTGAIRWRYEPDMPGDTAQYGCCDVVSRGVSYGNGKIFVGRLDGRLAALDAKTGEELWNIKVVDYKAGRGDHLAAAGGQEHGDHRLRRRRVRRPRQPDGLRRATGKQVWRTWLTPGAGEPGNDTWKGDSWKNGGAAPGSSARTTPKTNTVLYGTSNPSPWNNAVRGPDNERLRQVHQPVLSSTVAFDADTGKIKWHLQSTPYDAWDFDGVNEAVLTDLKHRRRQARGDDEGRPQRLLLRRRPQHRQADQRQAVRADQLGHRRSTWPPRGRSRCPTSARAWATRRRTSARTCSAARTGSRCRSTRRPVWSTSRPTTSAWTWSAAEVNYRKGTMYLGKEFPAKAGPGGNLGELVAWDPVKQTKAWGVKETSPFNGGTLTTAGGLVFAGNNGGLFRAFDAKHRRGAVDDEPRLGHRRRADDLQRRTASSTSRWWSAARRRFRPSSATSARPCSPRPKAARCSSSRCEPGRGDRHAHLERSAAAAGAGRSPAAAAATIVCAASALALPSPVAAGPAAPLRACADPDNLPFSSAARRAQGPVRRTRRAAGRGAGPARRRPSGTPPTTPSGRSATRCSPAGATCIVGLPARDFMSRQLAMSKPFATLHYASWSPIRSGRSRRCADLAGRRVAVQLSTPPHILLAAHDGVEAVTVRSADEGMQALADGRVDVAYLWGPSAGYLNRSVYGDRFRVQPMSGQDMAWPVAVAFRRGDEALRDDVQRELDRLAPWVAQAEARYGFVRAGRSGAAAPRRRRGQARRRAGAPAPRADKASIERGRTLFNNNCSHCHGPDAASPDAKIDLRRLTRRYHEDKDSVFNETVHKGRPDKGMPTWGGVLPERRHRADQGLRRQRAGEIASARTAWSAIRSRLIPPARSWRIARHSARS